jgi:shikimate 5-dehydrogenase
VKVFIFVCPEKAVSLANAIGGQALRLADLETFRPEEGMILANATSLGMQPNIDGTPIPKVLPHTLPFSLFLPLSHKHSHIIGVPFSLSQND